MSTEIREVRHASYIIPARIRDGKKEVAIIEYKPGEYGTIGGRFEDYDKSARDALRRELTEELNPGANKMADIAIEMSEPYCFCVAPERVALRCAHREEHHFFFAHIPADMEIIFCEQCPGNVHVVWVDAQRLVDGSTIGFPDEIEYFEKYIMPLVHEM